MNISSKIKSAKWHAWRLRNRLIENRLVYTVSLYYGLILKYIYKSLGKMKASPRETSATKINEVAFVFSHSHFDPQDQSPTRKSRFHSISNLARHLYGIFHNSHITYIDIRDTKITIPKVDLVIGILSKNFIEVAKANPHAYKILFLVNSSPFERARALLRESAFLHKKISWGEWVHPHTFMQHIPHVDHFITGGNAWGKKTYIDDGITEEKITLINWGDNLDWFIPDHTQRPKNKIRVAYFASQLGLRKGTYHVFRMWQELNKEKIQDDFELIILGGQSGIEKDLNDFVHTYKNARYEGWIDAHEPRYKELLQSSHIILGPSVEEGQVGCVLDGMACGAVPIITLQSGITITDKVEGYVIHDLHNPKEIANYILELSKNPSAIESMGKGARARIEKDHNWEVFEQAIRTCIDTVTKFK